MIRRERYNLFNLVIRFLRELFRISRREEPVQSRYKLDARLAFLLSLPETELSTIKKHEDARLRQVWTEINELQLELEAAREKGELDEEHQAQFQVRFETLNDRLFAPLTSGVYFPDDMPGVLFNKPHISAFVLSDASVQDLAELGVNVRSKAGDVFTAFIPLSIIPTLEASPAIRYIELSTPLFPTLDTAVPFAQIDTLHSAAPAVTGSGVIVGVIDTTFDIYHPDFRTPQGPTDSTDPTRVLFLWDQFLVPQGTESGPPTHPTLPGFLQGRTTYGVEYSQGDINTELANYNPPITPAYQTVRHGGSASSHGTHVAGIAAGNGRQDNRYVGAAPDADIIFVRYGAQALMPLADSVFVGDAFAYIFARASVLGQPCVVNMSSSSNQGPHDGTTLGEQFLDNLLLTPGRAITLAAGNTDNKNSHAAGQVAAGGTTNLVLNYEAFDTDADGTLDTFPINSDVIEIWYDGHDRFTITVTVPTTPATVIGPVAPGTMSGTVTLPNNVQVEVTSTLNDPRNGDNVISIIIDTGGNAIPTGNWNLALNGTTVINGNFQAWVERWNRGFRSWQAPHLQAGQLTIATPATGLRTIAVGNHQKPAAAGATPVIWVSSGAGPTRDGRVKPEIAATGRSVVAPRSRNMNAAAPGDFYTEKTGTSMSAPLVAGACALLFECRGAAATWADLKQILGDTAGSQGTAAGATVIPIPSNTFGFGYLQMANACAQPATDVDVWLRDDLTDTGVEPFTGGVIGSSPDIEVLDTAGNPAANPTYHPTNRYNSVIQVTIRNRGTQTARNTEVYLYWADPATHIPFPNAWRFSGIYTGEPNYLAQGNKIVVPQLAAGSTTQVRFAWAPPAPGSNIRGNEQFCLLARLENEADASQIGAGGFTVIRARNNIALRNVYVQPAPAGDGDEDAEMTFYVVGSADQDSLFIDTQLVKGQVEFTLPVQALPWRDMRLTEEITAQREPYGADVRQGCALIRWLFPGIFSRLFPVYRAANPLHHMTLTLEGSAVEMRTDIEGAKTLRLQEGQATVASDPGKRLFIKRLRLAEGAKMPVRLRVCRPDIDRDLRFVHVTQLSGGQYIGGVTLELRPADELERDERQ